MVELIIRMNDGTRLTTKVQEYNAESLTEELNNHQKMLVNIGPVIVQKHNIVSIVPLDQMEEE